MSKMSELHHDMSSRLSAKQNPADIARELHCPVEWVYFLAELRKSKSRHLTEDYSPHNTVNS
jgi:hypothetical protein